MSSNICWSDWQTKVAFLQASPLMDRVVFKKTKAAFGGRVRFVVSGGAPLGPSVEEFLNITLCCPVLQVRQFFDFQGDAQELL